MTLELNGAQIRLLREGLQKSFPGFDSFKMFLTEQVDKNLNNYAGEGSLLPYAAFEVVRYAEAEGWLAELLAAAQATRPNRPEFLRVATELGLTAAGPNLSNQRPISRVSTPPGQQLESIIRGRERFVDVEDFLRQVSLLQAQVCRIEISDPQGTGTGFLVAPDLVLTNFHVMQPVLDGQRSIDDVVCRFDYRKLPGGSEVRGGLEVRLDKSNWLVAKSKYSEMDKVLGAGEPGIDELDYCVMRLQEPVGKSKVGASTEPTVPERGWVRTLRAQSTGSAGDDVFILQHPGGQPLKMAIGQLLQFNGNSTRMRYDADTLRGSSGSPIFNSDLKLIGLHHRGDLNANEIAMTAEHNQGIPITRIIAQLEADNVPAFWGA